MSTSSKIKPVNGKVGPKVMVIIIALLVSLLIAVGVFYPVFNNNSIRPESISDISGMYGGGKGIANITQTRESSPSGVDATTLHFEVAETSTAPVSYSVEYMADTLANIRNSGIVNLSIEGKGKIKERDISVDVKYYAASDTDYSDGSFMKVNRLIETLMELGAEDISIVSTPTVDKGRTVDVKMSTTDWDVEAFSFKQLWGKTVTALQTSGTLDSQNVYTLSLTNNTPEVEEGQVQRTATTLRTMFYDADTLEMSKNPSPEMWSTVVAYSKNKDFGFATIKEVIYTLSPKETSSKIALIIHGEQPESDGVNALVTKFEETALKNVKVHFPYEYTTSIRYSNSADEVYTNYSSNIIY